MEDKIKEYQEIGVGSYEIGTCDICGRFLCYFPWEGGGPSLLCAQCYEKIKSSEN